VAAGTLVEHPAGRRPPEIYYYWVAGHNYYLAGDPSADGTLVSEWTAVPVAGRVVDHLDRGRHQAGTGDGWAAAAATAVPI
jgi:hypothetical protein